MSIYGDIVLCLLTAVSKLHTLLLSHNIICLFSYTIYHNIHTPHIRNNNEGSLFELTSGSETLLGFAGTAALAAIGAPLALFFIYAAILKGVAETEEDDRKFNSRPRKL